MSFFERLAAFKAECEACAPGACVGCQRDGEHCDGCPAHAPLVELPSVATVTQHEVGEVEVGGVPGGTPSSAPPTPPNGAKVAELRQAGLISREAAAEATPFIDVGEGKADRPTSVGQAPNGDKSVPPPPAPPKWRCTKCGKGTTKARVLGSGMCGPCERIFTRPSLDETLDSIPVEWERDVEKALREQPTYDRAAAVMKKKHPLKGGRDWDMVLVLMVDHRKRMREGKYW